MPDTAPTRLGIVGVGLVGGSVGLAAAAAWPGLERIGLDEPAALDAARAAGCIDGVAPNLAALAQCDIVVLAAPIPAILEHLAAWAPNARALLTDVGSTKRQIVRAAAHLPKFVGGHPVAGMATAGVARASASLFAGRPWALTPTAATDAEALDTVRRCVCALGARPTIATPDDHDRVMAFVSHLPQLLSVALMNTAAQAGRLAGELAGPGFRDMTRLASSPGELWRGILATNDDNVREALRTLKHALPGDAEPLDLEAVVRAFVAANDRRARLPEREDG